MKKWIVCLIMAAFLIGLTGCRSEVPPDSPTAGGGENKETADSWQDEGEIYSLPVIKFNAQKWRSPLGAYYFSDCFVVWPEMGTWESYEIGSELIS